jgi:DNA invertase Pin-like site-specific DNA recombinase
MQNPLFARPNLKIIALVGLLLAAVAQCIRSSHCELAVVPVQARSPRSPEAVREELDQLLAACRARPSAMLCLRIAECYRQLGDFKEALRYLRRGDRLGFDEDDLP